MTCQSQVDPEVLASISDPRPFQRDAASNDRFVGGTPLVLEIIGLAGSGKTTLSKALCQQNQGIVAGTRFAIKQPNQIPSYLGHLLTLPPALILQPRGGRRISRREMKNVVCLKGWPRALKRQACRHDAVVVVDQGGAFKLANLHGFGPPWLRSPSFSNWWDGMFNEWASVLDFVVCLDAPNELLIKRIRTRSTWHSLKEQSDDEALRFLSTYRSSCEHVLSKLTTNNQVKLLHFDTSCRLPEQILSDVLSALNGTT